MIESQNLSQSEAQPVYLGPHFHRDGHVLNLLLGPDCAVPEITCPGEGKCEGLRVESGVTWCVVKRNVAEDPGYFLEMQDRHKGDENTEIALPIEIEWRDHYDSGGYWSDPEYEFWWRPVLDSPAAKVEREG